MAKRDSDKAKDPKQADDLRNSPVLSEIIKQSFARHASRSIGLSKKFSVSSDISFDFIIPLRGGKVMEIIEREKHKNPPVRLKQKLHLLIEYSRKNSQMDAIKFADTLFADELESHGVDGIADLVSHPSSTDVLPQMATLLWKDRKLLGAMAPNGEPWTPPEFIKVAYGPWVGKGLTRALIRQLDNQLSEAINNYQRSNDWPSDLPLPKQRDPNDARLQQIADMEAAGIEPKFSLQEARRLAAAHHRRNEK